MEYNLYFTHAQGKVIPEHLHLMVSKFETIINDIINNHSAVGKFYIIGELENTKVFFCGKGDKRNLYDLIEVIDDVAKQYEIKMEKS